MPRLVAFTGLSRSGKDTAAKAFVENGFRSYNMARPMKETIERLYGLPDGAMEDDYYRKAFVPRGGTKTYLDMMVELADKWRTIDPYCMVTPVERHLRSFPVDTVMTGIRFLEEVEMLYSLQDVYQVYLAHCERPGVKALPSDRAIPLCLDCADLLDLSVHHLRNNGDLKLWQEKAQRFYEVCTVSAHSAA